MECWKYWMFGTPGGGDESPETFAPPHSYVMAGGKSSESVQCAMLKACDACADMGQL